MRLIALVITIVIFMAFSAYAQYETLSGIPAGSPEYENYKLCIDSCKQCEANCKSSTYRLAAETQNKEEFCNYLPEGEKEMCLDRIIMANAIIRMDSAECQRMTNEFQKSGCLLNVQTEKAIAAESEAECNSAPEGMIDICKQSFYQRMAMQKSDETYCAKITEEMSRKICSDNVAMQKSAAAPITEIETNAEEEPAESSGIKNKSLITYGIIILGVIIIAVIAIVIIKKVMRKKPAQPVPLMVQQQKFPPLTIQSQQGVQQSAPQIQGEKR